VGSSLQLSAHQKPVPSFPIRRFLSVEQQRARAIFSAELMFRVVHFFF